MRKLVLSVGMLVLCSLPAQAALLSCPSSFTADGTAKVFYGANLSAASACQYLDPADNSNVASLANINTAAFFGTSTWTLNGANLQVTPASGGSGTWSITGANFATTDYMLVFKDGADTNLIGFLLNGEAASGSWTTPFTEPPFDLSGGSVVHDVSHFTLVQRIGGTPPPPPPPPPPPIPEPTTLVMLGVGLIGIARKYMRR